MVTFLKSYNKMVTFLKSYNKMALGARGKRGVPAVTTKWRFAPGVSGVSPPLQQNGASRQGKRGVPAASRQG